MRESNIEMWRVIKGFEGYAVSNLGRVKSLNYRGVTGREQILKPRLGGKEGDQYLQVDLYKCGVGKSFGVHVLVALAFPEICGLPFEGAQCNHIDEDHFNNRADNLNWMTPAQNSNHGTRNERIAKANTNGKLSKKVYQYTKDTHELVGEYPSAAEVERQTGWHHANISMCCNGKKKSAYGFLFSYTLL